MTFVCEWMFDSWVRTQILCGPKMTMCIKIRILKTYIKMKVGKNHRDIYLLKYAGIKKFLEIHSLVSHMVSTTRLQLCQNMWQVQHRGDSVVWFHWAIWHIASCAADPSCSLYSGIKAPLNIRVQSVSHHNTVLGLHLQHVETQREDGEEWLLLCMFSTNHDGVEELLASDCLHFLSLDLSYPIGQQQQLVPAAQLFQEVACFRGQTEDLQATILPKIVTLGCQRGCGTTAHCLLDALLPVTHTDFINGSASRGVKTLVEKLLLELVTNVADSLVIEGECGLQKLTGL